jgi:hypothetical protein
MARLRKLVGEANLHPVAESGGKLLLTNSLSGATAGSSLEKENAHAIW